MSSTASRAYRLETADTAEVRLLGQRITLFFERVEDEFTRRQQMGLRPVDDRELLMALFALPVDLPVPRVAVEARHQRLFQRAPTGVVDLSRRDLTRRAVPAVRIVHVTGHGVASVSRLRSLSMFGPFSSRSIVVTGRVPEDDALAEAERLGIGMIRSDGSVLADERPLFVRRHTAATWLFAEHALAALIAAGAVKL